MNYCVACQKTKPQKEGARITIKEKEKTTTIWVCLTCWNNLSEYMEVET